MSNYEEFYGMNLGVLSHKFLWRDKEGLKVRGGFGKQMEALAENFESVLLCVPLTEKDVPAVGYRLDESKFSVMPLPEFNSTGLMGKLKFLFKLPVYFYRIWCVYPQVDIWQFRLPGYLGLLGLVVHKLRDSQPVFVWLGTDWASRIRESGSGSWVRRGMAKLADILLHWLLRDIPVFALGVMAEQYEGQNPYVHATWSTIISDEEIVPSVKVETSSPLRILYVGRLAQEKGLRYLIEAIQSLKQKNCLVELMLVGDGPELDALTDLAERLTVRDQVLFHGYVPAGKELWQLYHQADLFVLPSLSEAQGKVLLEAMAAGLAIVATNVGGIPTVIQDGENGILVAAHSGKAIANAIERLLIDDELRQSLANNGLGFVKQYTVGIQTQMMLTQLRVDLANMGYFEHG